MQVKLLRTIQEREIQRVGSDKTVNIDVITSYSIHYTKLYDPFFMAEQFRFQQGLIQGGAIYGD